MSSCSRGSAFIRTLSPLQAWWAALLLVGVTTPTLAAQVDIVGPPGGGRFGNQVLALPNGNVAVSDPYSADWSPRPGAVHLYSADGTLISTLTGTGSSDSVGADLRSLGNGNFVVLSNSWGGGRGAVTFVDGTTGLSGAVSAANSLVGSQIGDSVGHSYFDSLFEPPPMESFWVVGGNNYVVVSNHWSDGSKINVGAVTWCNGTTGCTGPVSSANSLIGGTAEDFIGTSGVTVLRNGNYVVLSSGWDDLSSGRVNVGAATWGSGSSGVAGVVTAANSLVGSHTNDFIYARVEPLSNGNYVLGVPMWDNGATSDAGAAVWANGTSGAVGSISSANAFVGSHFDDQVGYNVTALSNGHYVLCDPLLDMGPFTDVGAATWGNGETGLTGTATALNSLTGSASGKGPRQAIALATGNYVVISPEWDAGGAPGLGAVTWADGSAATSGTVTSSNSLVGTSADDHVGTYVVALSNGNYVVGTPGWDGVAEDVGAATWANGSTGLVGTVSASNSLVGAVAFDGAYGVRITPLRNGNYVVANPGWDDGSAIQVGAVTWGNGSSGIVGTVSAANSLVGGSAGDYIGNNGVIALSNGNYAVGSLYADLGGHSEAGAVTWGDGTIGTVGIVSTNNSLYGTADSDRIGSSGMTAMSDGSYVIRSNTWSTYLGAISLGNGSAPYAGPLSAANSVLGIGSPWMEMSYDYDAIHHRLAVGRIGSNIVTLLTLDADEVFADGFDGQ